MSFLSVPPNFWQPNAIGIGRDPASVYDEMLGMTVPISGLPRLKHSHPPVAPKKSDNGMEDPHIIAAMMGRNGNGMGEPDQLRMIFGLPPQVNPLPTMSGSQPPGPSPYEQAKAAALTAMGNAQQRPRPTPNPALMQGATGSAMPNEHDRMAAQLGLPRQPSALPSERPAQVRGPQSVEELRAQMAQQNAAAQQRWAKQNMAGPQLDQQGNIVDSPQLAARRGVMGRNMEQMNRAGNQQVAGLGGVQQTSPYQRFGNGGVILRSSNPDGMSTERAVGTRALNATPSTTAPIVSKLKGQYAEDMGNGRRVSPQGSFLNSSGSDAELQRRKDNHEIALAERQARFDATNAKKQAAQDRRMQQRLKEMALQSKDPMSVAMTGPDGQKFLIMKAMAESGNFTPEMLAQTFGATNAAAQGAVNAAPKKAIRRGRIVGTGIPSAPYTPEPSLPFMRNNYLSGR